MPKASPYGVRGLYKDADERYRIDLRYRDPKTRKPERYKEALPEGVTLGAAKTRALEVLNAAMGGTLLRRGADTAPETLGAAFEKYLTICDTNNPKADPQYKRRHRDQWVKTLGAGFRLDSFSELTIERHKRRRRDEGKEAGTINRELVTIKHFLNRAVEWGWLPKRPQIKLLQEPPPRVRWLTDDERVRLSAQLATPQRVAFRRVCAAALLSGQRLGKIIGLERADVDLSARLLTIRDMRKGGKVKTTHVPISPALEAVLREAIDAGDESPYVFTTRRRQDKGKPQPYSRNGASSFFRKVAAAAGIADLHFHDLRHDFATRLKRAGNGLDVIQALLGHSTMAMTQRYAHIGRPELAAAVESAEGVDLAAAPPSPIPAKPKRARATAS
jgi:integrase